MPVKYMMQGTTVSVVRYNEETALDKLPPKIYTVQRSMMQGFFLSVAKDKLQVPNKIYGNAMQRAQKCIDTYRDRSSSTGILMTGDKGTGKTLLMSLISNMMIEQLKLPVVLVRTAYDGDEAFKDFIEQLGECCLVFDEFGKMYSPKDDDEPGQGSLLSLMDGVDKVKRMIILSENEEYKINEYIFNRPSRIYYHFRYKKLDEDSIKGYSRDNNVPASVVEDILHLARKSMIFSFDMLQCIVEEYNRFQQPINEIIEDLNLELTEDVNTKMRILRITENDTDRECKLSGRGTISYHKDWDFDVRIVDPENSDDRDYVYFSHDNLVFQNGDKMVFKTSDYTIFAELLQTQPVNYHLLV